MAQVEIYQKKHVRNVMVAEEYNMHLERDILKGKFGKNKELKKEAEEEIEEVKEEKHGKHHKKDHKKEALEKKRKGSRE